jgi:hypothetical protein
MDSTQDPGNFVTYSQSLFQSGVTSKDIQRARRAALRTRSSIACAQCREAKTKCNDYRPCSRCKHNGDADNCRSDQSQYQVHKSSVRNTIDAAANSHSVDYEAVTSENNKLQTHESEPGSSKSRDYTSERHQKRPKTSDQNPWSQHAHLASTLSAPAPSGASQVILNPHDGASLLARLFTQADSQALAPSAMSHLQYCAVMASAAAATSPQLSEPSAQHDSAAEVATSTSAMAWQMPDHHANAAIAAAAAAAATARWAAATAAAGLGGAGGTPASAPAGAPYPSAFPWQAPAPWPTPARAQLAGAWEAGFRPLGPGGSFLAAAAPPFVGAAAWPPGPIAAGAFPFHQFAPGLTPPSGWELPPRLAPLLPGLAPRAPALASSPCYAGSFAPDCARPPY